MVNVRETKQALQNALVNQDPNRLARIFELPIANSSSSSSSSQPRKHNPQSFTVDGKDCGGLLTSLLDAHAASEVGNIEAVFEAQIKLHPKFNQLFGSSEGNWMVPAMIVVCKTTHKLGLEADRQILLKSKTKQNHHTKLQKVVPILQESYSKTFNDRTEYQPGAPFDNAGSKQAGVLAIVNELFGMYFRLNILRLCKNLIRPVETKKLSEKGSMSEMVTYRYYIGRLSMFEDDHPRAETNLEYALRHCHKSATSNKKRILKYLVPVKLYRGKLPTTYREYLSRIVLQRIVSFRSVSHRIVSFRIVSFAGSEECLRMACGCYYDGTVPCAHTVQYCAVFSAFCNAYNRTNIFQYWTNTDWKNSNRS
mmetsp:Transcript_12195/g.34880  ORF Transcript_12195/g.34880 Transcript_12195/m.34880 type:complete len:366 (+) Transcript_12195:151-1248(+)